MKVALCAIGRRENQYAVEFVNHYLKLGFNKVFIYDNNYDGEEHFEDVLNNYISIGLVEIINYRNKECCQLQAYNECYKLHNEEYDWIAFFDFDEFLVLEKHKTIQDFLINKTQFDAVLINWMVMTDNGLIRNDGRPLMERFTEHADVNENRLVKSIVRKGINNYRFSGNPHIIYHTNCCDTLGKPCKTAYFQPVNWDVAYLKHFHAKTIEEFMTRKMKVGTPDRKFIRFVNDYKDTFFKINKRTPEKEAFAKSLKLT